MHAAIPGQQEGNPAKLAEKRERNLFKKLFHLQTSRLLRILDYSPIEADERKYIHSNFKRAI